LELDLAGGQRLDRPVVKRRVGAAEAGDQLRTIGQSLEHLSKRFSRLTPCDEVIAQEPDGISGVKAAAHVVGSGWSHRPGPEARDRARHPRRVLTRPEVWIENGGSGETSLVRMGIDHPGGFL